MIFIGAIFLFTLFDRPARLSTASLFFGIAVLITFTITWSYFILFEWRGNGQTIGKRVFGLRVIAEDGAPASFTAVLAQPSCVSTFFRASTASAARDRRVFPLAAPRRSRGGHLRRRAPRPQSITSRCAPSSHRRGREVEVRVLPGEAQRLVREFVAREAKLAPTTERASLTARDRLRPYARDVDPTLG